jgi:hypothetical protein
VRRSAKPRISKKRLCWKWSKAKRTWEPYHRVTWTENGKRKERTILLDWQGDPERLDMLFWACEAGRHEKQIAPAKFTWGEIVIAWRKDPRIQRKLADSTKKSYRRDMDRIMEKNGAKDMRRTTRQAVRSAHDKLASTPRKADKYLQTISLLWNYAKNKLDWPIGDNPASGIDHYGKQREYDPWPSWMIEKLSEAPEIVKRGAELILGTGQRPGAAIPMRFDQFRGDVMEVQDEKGGETFEVYCPDELQEFLARIPREGRHVIAKNLTEPVGYNAVEKAFRAWRKDLGDAAKPYVLHGLRKLSIIRLAEAGCTDAEIQAVTNQSAEMVAYYRKKASRKALSKAARNRTKTKQDV